MTHLILDPKLLPGVWQALQVFQLISPAIQPIGLHLRGTTLPQIVF